MKQSLSVFLCNFKEMFQRLIICIAAAAVGVSAGGSGGCSSFSATVAALAKEYSLDELNATCLQRFEAVFDAAVIAENTFEEYFNIFGQVYDDCANDLNTIATGFEAKVFSLVGVTTREELDVKPEDAPYPIKCVVQQFFDYYIKGQMVIISLRSFAYALLEKYEQLHPAPSSFDSAPSAIFDSVPSTNFFP